MPRSTIERIAVAAALACGACASAERTIPQFSRTIPDRQADPDAPRPHVPLSFADEIPALADAPAPAHPPEQPPTIVTDEREATPRVGGDERFTFDWRGVQVAQALFHVAETAGVSMYVDPGLDRIADVSLRNATLDDALAVLLESNGLCMRKDEHGVYWVDVCDGSQSGRADFFVQSIDATEIEPRLRALIGTNTRLVVDGPQNLIVVEGARRDVDSVSRYLEAADRLKRQVLVDVRLLEVTLGENFQFGIEASVNDITIGGSVTQILQSLQTPNQDFVVDFTSSDGTIEAAINAIARYAGVNLISSPRVMAITGTAANIEVLREVPYYNVTSVTTGTTGGIGNQVIQEVQFKDAGTKLKVTPTIQEGGVILLKIDQDLSEVVDFFNGVPVLDSRHIASEFQVRDRGTIVLGGLMQDSKREIDKGVPILMDIPLLGRLFRSDEDANDRRELLVFLTPRIVDPLEATHLAHELRNQWTEHVKADGMGPKTKD